MVTNSSRTAAIKQALYLKDCNNWKELDQLKLAAVILATTVAFHYMSSNQSCMRCREQLKRQAAGWSGAWYVQIANSQI